MLSAVIERAHATGLDIPAWQLAWSVTGFLDWHGHWHELATALRLGFDAARRADDLVGQAHMYRGIATVDERRGRYPDSIANLRRALELFDALGDEVNQARTLLGLADTAGRLNNPHEALRHVEVALRLYQAVEHLPGQAEALNGIGWFQARLGDDRQAIVHCEQALVLHRKDRPPPRRSRNAGHPRSGLPAPGRPRSPLSALPPGDRRLPRTR